MEKLTLRIPEAAKALGISRNLGYELARSGRFSIPIIRLGRRLVVSSRPLQQLLAGTEAQQDRPCGSEPEGGS